MNELMNRLNLMDCMEGMKQFPYRIGAICCIMPEQARETPIDAGCYYNIKETKYVKIFPGIKKKDLTNIVEHIIL